MTGEQTFGQAESLQPNLEQPPVEAVQAFGYDVIEDLESRLAVIDTIDQAASVKNPLPRDQV